MDDFGAVNGFLAANYRTGLEEALCDGCLVGRLSIVLADVATITSVLVHSERDDDGGFCNTYEGTLMVQGVAYRFRCHVFMDRSGARFLSDVSEFRPLEWQARLAMPGCGLTCQTAVSAAASINQARPAARWL